jgi:hypothetical protein
MAKLRLLDATGAGRPGEDLERNFIARSWDRTKRSTISFVLTNAI